MTTNSNAHHTQGQQQSHEALEVVATYGDTPQQVHQYRRGERGRIKAATWAMLGAGLALAIFGAVAFGSQLINAQRQAVPATGNPESVAVGERPQRSARPP